jgi:quinol monooxygenase YgiN
VEAPLARAIRAAILPGMERRTFLLGSAVAATLAPVARAADAPAPQRYGQIGRMIATPGQRDALIAILLEGTAAMPGCLSYIVAKDTDDADAIWVTEVWDSEASHDASLQLPAVQAAIDKGRQLIAKMDTGAVTVPVGGVGLGKS